MTRLVLVLLWPLALFAQPAPGPELQNAIAAHAGDPQALSLLASTLERQGRAAEASQVYVHIEAFFETALKSSPADFRVLYNLGIAATRAGHPGRAREVLEAAVRLDPRNVDALYALAFVHYTLREFEKTVQLLSQAARIEPRRPDVQRLLAVATTDLGALDDASAAWDRYLALQPGDAEARRERGYNNFQRGRLEEGIADLEWYTAGHPDDAVGHYELGQAERARDLGKAMQRFNRALELDPNYVPALAARAALVNQQGKPEQALPDLEKAAALRPDDPAALDRLGQTYQALDRTADAVRVLRRAAELAPSDSKTLLHFARALADSGDTAQSKLVMDRFRQLGPEKKVGVPAGFVDYLGLTDEQRRADYRARIEKAIREKPGEMPLRVDYLKLLLSERKFDEAAKAAGAITGTEALADSGRALLAARQYALAAGLLRKSGAAPVDLAIAALFADAQSRGELGDWRPALELAPDRLDLHRQLAAFLVAHGRAADAFALLDRSAGRWPDDREVLLRRAVAAELAGQSETADRGLADLRARWPEWHASAAAHGMILARRGKVAEARKALETATALGASMPSSPDRKAAGAWLLGLF